MGAVVDGEVLGEGLGAALCGRTTHEPTVYVMSSIAMSP